MSHVPISANDIMTLASIELALGAVVVDKNEQYGIDPGQVDLSAPGIRTVLRRLNVDETATFSPIGETRRNAAIRLANAAINVERTFSGDFETAFVAFSNVARAAARYFSGEERSIDEAIADFAAKTDRANPIEAIRNAKTFDDFIRVLLLTASLVDEMCILSSPVGCAFFCDVNGSIGWRADEMAIFDELRYVPTTKRGQSNADNDDASLTD